MTGANAKIKRIMVGDKQVRPKTRNPGENTMFYIPFKSDSLDHSDNGVTTSGGGTITYQNPGALITDSFCANYTQNPSSFTVSVWCKSPNSSGEKKIIEQAYIVVGSYNGWDLIFQNNSIRVEFLKPSQNIVWQQAVSNVGVTNWHLVTLTVDNGTTGNVYIDGELKMTHSVSGYNPYQIAYRMGQASINTYLGDVILENKVRTAQEILDYYNLTKSNYGL